MTRSALEWKVYNGSQGEAPSPLLSVSHGIGILVELSRKEIGETLYLEHETRGLIISTVGSGRATLTFVPQYDRRTQSLYGKQNARSSVGGKELQKELQHVDSNGCLSSIPPRSLLPIVDVVRAFVYIVETIELPEFLEWSPPATAS